VYTETTKKVWFKNKKEEKNETKPKPTLFTPYQVYIEA